VVEYGLRFLPPTGTALQQNTKRFDGIGQRLAFFDVGGVEYALRNSPDSNPLTGELAWSSPAGTLTARFAPTRLDPNVVGPAFATLEPTIPPFPAQLKLGADLLEPVVLGTLAIAIATLGPAATVAAPTIDKGSIDRALEKESVVLSVLTPAFAGPSAGGPTPDVFAIATGIVAPLIRKAALPFAIATVGPAFEVLAPTLAPQPIDLAIDKMGFDTKVITPARILQGNAQLGLNPTLTASTLAVLAPASVTRGILAIAPATLALASSVHGPAPSGPLSPPTGVGTTSAQLGLLAPVLEQAAIARAPAAVAWTSSVVTPAIAHGAVAREPAVTSTQLQVVAPAAIAPATKAVVPATLAAAAAPLAPAIAYGHPVDLAGAAATVLAPTIVHGDRAIAPATLELGAGLLVPLNETPLILLQPDVVGFAAGVLEPDVDTAGSELAIAPATLDVQLALRGGTVVLDGDEDHVELQLKLRTIVDYTGEEPGVIVAAQQNAVGLPIHLVLRKGDGSPLDLTLATQVQVYLQPPQGQPKVRNATVYGEPTLGVVRYVTVAGDLHAFGLWEIQARVRVSQADCWSNVEVLDVKSNLGPAPTNVPDPQITTVSVGVLAPSISFS